MTGASDSAARALGWASIGIGLLELAAPEAVEKMLGVPHSKKRVGVLRVCGVREVMQGVDILTHDDPRPGLWTRVAGDMLDGVLLSVAGMHTREPMHFAATAAAVMGIVAMDMACAIGQSVGSSAPRHASLRRTRWSSRSTDAARPPHKPGWYRQWGPPRRGSGQYSATPAEADVI